MVDDSADVARVAVAESALVGVAATVEGASLPDVVAPEAVSVDGDATVEAAVRVDSDGAVVEDAADAAFDPPDDGWDGPASGVVVDGVLTVWRSMR